MSHLNPGPYPQFENSRGLLSYPLMTSSSGNCRWDSEKFWALPLYIGSGAWKILRSGVRYMKKYTGNMMKYLENIYHMYFFSFIICVRPFQEGPLCRFYNLSQNYACNFLSSYVILVAYWFLASTKWPFWNGSTHKRYVGNMWKIYGKQKNFELFPSK